MLKKLYQNNENYRILIYYIGKIEILINNNLKIKYNNNNMKLYL